MVCMYLLVLKTKKEAVGSRSSRVLTLEKAPATSSAVRACALPAEAAKKDEATVRGAATAGISHFLSSCCCCCCWDEEEEEEEEEEAVLRDRRGAEFLLLIDLLERFRAREVVPGNAAALLVMAATCIALKACAISILSLFHCPLLPSFLELLPPTKSLKKTQKPYKTQNLKPPKNQSSWSSSLPPQTGEPKKKNQNKREKREESTRIPSSNTQKSWKLWRATTVFPERTKVPKNSLIPERKNAGWLEENKRSIGVTSERNLMGQIQADDKLLLLFRFRSQICDE